VTTNNNLNYRLIDANLNRLKEGLRVLEDISRYLLNNKTLTIKIKTLRHKSNYDNPSSLLKTRNTNTDVLKNNSLKSEKSRKNIQDIILANSKRVQESARVLEEILKLEDSKYFILFKEIRYSTYEIEKELFFIYENANQNI
jgi:thiamine-phosphate pyrophosphorylase